MAGGGLEIRAEHVTALKDADNLISDILAAADIDRDGKISFDGAWTCHCAGCREGHC